MIIFFRSNFMTLHWENSVGVAILSTTRHFSLLITDLESPRLNTGKST